MHSSEPLGMVLEVLNSTLLQSKHALVGAFENDLGSRLRGRLGMLWLFGIGGKLIKADIWPCGGRGLKQLWGLVGA